MAKKTDREKKKNYFSIPRRAAWFIFRTSLLVGVVVLLALFVFLTAMHAANIYIIVTEGMTLRTSCILGNDDPNVLYEYFTDSFVLNDPAFNDNIYDHYEITKYDYRLNVESISILPWNTTASMTVTERIPSITGTANIDAPSSAIPAWKDATYKVICTKISGRWLITKINLVEENPQEKPKATPNMSIPPKTIAPTQTPLPTADVAKSSVTTTKKPKK